jgi:anti-sigma regulatory factor (Ser/Thr protein kinase)
MADPVTLKIELPKIPDIELVAIEGLQRLARHLGIADEKIGEARILIAEAIINGLEHAGSDNPRVDVEFTIDEKELVIFVRDYGKGFDPEGIEEPDLASKMGSDYKRGWGLKLMKSMSDDFRIESNTTGTRITLRKLLR